MHCTRALFASSPSAKSTLSPDRPASGRIADPSRAVPPPNGGWLAKARQEKTPPPWPIVTARAYPEDISMVSYHWYIPIHITLSASADPRRAKALLSCRAKVYAARHTPEIPRQPNACLLVTERHAAAIRRAEPRRASVPQVTAPTYPEDVCTISYHWYRSIHISSRRGSARSAAIAMARRPLVPHGPAACVLTAPVRIYGVSRRRPSPASAAWTAWSVRLERRGMGKAVHTDHPIHRPIAPACAVRRSRPYPVPTATGHFTAA